MEPHWFLSTGINMEYTPLRLLSNITTSYQNLRTDFIGISFHLSGILHFLSYILFVFLLFSILYLIGEKIRRVFFKVGHSPELAPFISIALGYIVVGSGIALLGMFSLFYSVYLMLYLFALILFSLYPLHFLRARKDDVILRIRNYKEGIRRHPWLYLTIFGFLLIGFLRLIPPEIGEDAIGYHTELPRLYLATHTMILESREIQRVLPIPQLGEMLYVITEFLGIRDASRYVHFAFYVLVITVLCSIRINKKTKLLGVYAAVLFVSAPIIVRIYSIANVDFPALFCWLLSVILITKSKNFTSHAVTLAAILFGGALATKLWEIAFLSIFFLYFLITQKSKWYALKLSIIFLFTAFLTSSIWFLRSYIITGNPLFPAFSHISSSGKTLAAGGIFSYVGINSQLFSLPNLVVFGPLFFLGILFSIALLPGTIRILKNSGISLFFILLAFEHLVITYYIPRYLLSLYSVFLVVAAVGASQFIQNVRIGRYIFFSVLFILFSYYFLNTLLILPYGLGWADKDRYLTRILSRDSSSYYDFDHLFSKHLTTGDLVAVYGLAGFYYANFKTIDVGYIFDSNSRSFDLLRKKGLKKLLIFGGTVEWFCKEMHLTKCDPHKYRLLVAYDPGRRYLYSLSEK